MRTATACTLCAMLATVSLSYNQVSAATLAVRTQPPRVNVHIPPPKVQVKSSPVVVTHGTHVKGIMHGTHFKTGQITARDKETPTENINLNFGKVKMEYKPQNANGNTK